MMKKLNMKIHIMPTLSAADWQLYTSSMDCTYAAQRLNEKLAALVNQGLERREVEKEMSRLMNTLSEFGAADSEPFYVLELALNAVFGRSEIDDWK
jgi:hypothetical protein